MQSDGTLRVYVAILFVTLLWCVPAAATAGVLNGSFESYSGGADGDPGRTVYTPSSGTINDWKLDGVGDVYLHHTPLIGNTIGAEFNFAQDGGTYLDLSGGISGGTSGNHARVYQDFATIPSQEYSLSFYIGAARSPAASINVQLNGASSLLNQTLAAAAPSTNIVWTPYVFSFVADSVSTRLSFKDLSTFDDNYSFVDNVSVTASGDVPEPTSMILWALVSAGMSVGRRSRS
ncbi:MAG: DUF642 domain-containing protein [Pirellulales bacterium]